MKPTTLLLLIALFSQSPCFSQGTAFTYQGQLKANGGAANGNYDLRFTLWDAASGPSPVGGAVGTNAVPITNGLFTVTLDFGPEIFTGANRWLEINVRTNGTGSFDTLAPRQFLAATPYAITAGNVTGVLPSSALAGTYSNAVAFTNSANIFNGNGTGLTNVNAASLGSLTALNFWQTAGNAGTTPSVSFLGTSDNQPLEIKVNGTRAFRLEPGAFSGTPNVIGGSSFNTANGAAGATIAGGGLGSSNPNRIAVNFGTIGGGYANSIDGAAYDATIGGGAGNSIAQNAQDSTIGGGLGNAIDSLGDSALIGGGNGNHIDSRGTNSTIGGGFGNRIQTNNFSSTIAGGYSNRIGTNSEAATIGGGEQNIAAGRYTVIAGGRQNTNAGLLSTIAGGSYNRALGEGISIGGGLGNSGQTNYSTISGGFLNQNKGQLGTIGGGERNFLGGDWATVGGGYENVCYGRYGTVPGGSENGVYADYGFAAGRGAYVFDPGCFVWADSQPNLFQSTGPNQFDIRAAGGVHLNPETDLFWGSGAQLRSDQGGAIELGNSLVADTPYIDFHYGTGSQQDYNVRIINDATGQLSVFQPDSTLRLMRLYPGGMEVNGTFVSASDRNVKAGFEPVDSKAILEKVSVLPITRWHYTNDIATPHIGPMAQDFSAAFKVGSDDKHIATVDADGVALAAIQGLNQKLEEKEARIRSLERTVAELKQLMTQLTDAK